MINPYQTLITIYKTITYEPINISTNGKNIRQIRLFMQNKAKVKIGKIKPVLSGIEWANQSQQRKMPIFISIALLFVYNHSNVPTNE
jgi:hypothetical protein